MPVTRIENAHETYDSYSPEFAGEPIVWAGIAENEGFDFVSVAGGIVGDEGAQIYHPNGTPINIDDEGLESIFGFDLVLPKYDKATDTPDIHVTIRANGDPEHTYAKSIASRGLRLTDNVGLFEPSPIECGAVFVGSKSVVDGIKEALHQKDLDVLYSRAYFTMAYLMDNGHLIGDLQMWNETEAEMSAAQDTTSALIYMIDEDKGMLGDLTVFGNVDQTEIPDRFILSRKNIKEDEERISKVGADTHLADKIPYIGFRPGGRTWPYMSAVATSDQGAYGRELDGLKDNSVEPAKRELEREVDELSKRLTEAGKLAHKMAKLHTAEEKYLNVELDY